MFTSTESMYADAYTLQHVPHPAVHNFNYIAGIVPFLVNLIKDVSILLIKLIKLVYLTMIEELISFHIMISICTCIY